MKRAHVMLAGGVVALLSAAAQAANIRSYLEARRITPVVYVGVVEEERILERTKFALQATASVRVLGVVKSLSKRTPAEATLRYASWDDRTPPLAGGPQYKLAKGMYVLAFAASFDDRFPDGFLIRGTKDEVLAWARRQREEVAKWTDEQLKFNEITEADRKPQLAVYDKVIDLLEMK